MEADEVYSELNDKISDLKDKNSEFQGTIDSLNSTLNDLKSSAEKTRSDLDSLNDAVSELKSRASGASTQDSQQSQGLLDITRKIEEANAAAEKRYQDQQGLIGKLAAQAEDAAKMAYNFPDTAKAIANQAWQDGKKEILGIWDDAKKDILGSISGITTDLIKDAKSALKDELLGNLTDALKDLKGAIKSEIEDGVKSLVLDDVKQAEADAKASQPTPLSDADLEAKIATIVQQQIAAKAAGA
jgi:uncharacterized coiled-coil DUF342 family protein